MSSKPPKGAKITLNDLHGKVVLLDYWATWCAPCIEGLPELEAVYQKYRSNPRVAILAVNPLMGDTPEKIHAFYEQKHLTVPLAFDKHFAEPKPVAEAVILSHPSRCPQSSCSTAKASSNGSASAEQSPTPTSPSKPSSSPKSTPNWRRSRRFLGFAVLAGQFGGITTHQIARAIR